MAHPYDDRYRDEYRGQRGPGRDDRGLLERAGDEVRSWFGDDEAERRRRYDEERARRERMTSERGWTGGERGEGPDRWRDQGEAWRAESERWRPEPGRWQGEPGRTDYGRSTRAWNEPGYGRWPEDGRSMPEDRGRPGYESRGYGERWRTESGGMWGPATWSQGDRWRREGGDPYADRTARPSHWGAWPREDSASSQRHAGESRGYYEDDRGYTHQFAHRDTSPGSRGMGYAGRAPKNYRRSDERIREEICDRLTDDWRVDPSEMEVTVNDGQVTLSGAVHSRDEKRQAEDLVEAIPGVHDVHNNLRVSGWDDRYGSGSSLGSGGMTTGSSSNTTSGTTASPNQPNPSNPSTAANTRR